MTLPVVFTANGPSGYNLTKSLRFRSSASAYLSRTFGSATSTTTGTFSFWMKRGKLSNNYQYLWSSSNVDLAYFDSSDNLWIAYLSNLGYVNTNAVFRDPSAWYHIMIVFDTTNATAANRLQVYVNGVAQSLNWGSTPQTQNATFQRWNVNGYTGDIGDFQFNHTNNFDGYFAEYYWIDGQALTPSSFGSTNALTGVWQPAKYTGTYGTNGFYLPFTNTTSTTTLGYDFSGNSNNWTTNNLSLTTGSTYDSMTDVPTLTSATTANYAVLNPLQTNNSGALTYANGNLNAAHGSGTTSTGGVYKALSSMASSSGKFYAEFVLNSFYSNGAAGADMAVGVTSDLAAGNLLASPVGYSYYADGGNKYNNGAGAAYGSSWTTGDVIGIALDVTNGKVWFSKNNTWQASGDPAAGTNAAFTGLTGSFAFAFANSTASTAFVQNFTLNFGQQGFTYTPPTGFVALNTYNLPTSTIVKGNTVMDVNTWTGTGATNVITNAGAMQPDFVWMKGRSNATYHMLTNSVTGSTKYLYSNDTLAEGTWTDQLTSFNSNGFTLGADTNGTTNFSGRTYVGWQWQAGQGTTSSNTSGSITSTVSVNATAGFSIVTWTGTASGATVGHGLGVAPKMIIIKNRSSATNWPVWQTSYGGSSNTDYQYLNTTDSKGGPGAANNWNNTAPTSSVISVGDTAGSNGSGASMVAYCWSEIAGFSKFTSYTGNGSADGSFVYCGFLPRFVMIKRTDTTANWYIFDTARDTYNAAGLELYPNLSNAEADGRPDLDILSNGIKLRSTATGQNANGGTYIIAAFASNPFKNALAR